MMVMSRVLALPMLALSLSALSGPFFSACAPPPTALPPVASLDTGSLGPGDLFEVRVYQEPDLSGAYRVGSDGTISFPLLGKVPVAGKTTASITDDLIHRLQDGYIKSPQVSILVKEYNSKKIFVLGQVVRPGAFSYSDNMSIVNAIAEAGGFTRSALPNQTNVTRVVDGREVRTPVHVGDIGKGEEKNFTLAPGDIVYVPESFF